MRLMKRMAKMLVTDRMVSFKKQAAQDKEEYLKSLAEETGVSLEEVKEIYEMLGEDDFALEGVLADIKEANEVMENDDYTPSPEDLKEWMDASSGKG